MCCCFLEEEEDPKAKSFVAPHVCWSKDRVESDLNLSTELVQKLDAEKGIAENPVLATAPDKKPEGQLRATAPSSPLCPMKYMCR